MTTTTTASPRTPFGRWKDWVTKETTGGALLLGAAMIALIWANTPWGDGYHAFSSFRIGPDAIGLNLSLAHWAADGLLAIFFFLVGVELKHDLVVGALSNLKQAAVPVIAAVGGMIAPATIYTVVILISGDQTALNGWAIPSATDIAFALAVLAVFGRGLPRALRVFMMTLAVVDDLLAIIIIAIFYTSGLNPVMLLGTAACVAAFYFVIRTRRAPWWILVPLGVLAWWFMFTSGVHATIAGVVLGFCVPARPVHSQQHSRTHQIEQALQPYSAGIVLPIFAFFAAGVTFIGEGGASEILLQPVVLAIVLGLSIGKIIGVMLTTTLVIKLTPLRLPGAIKLPQLLPVAMICGIGFTVSLLIADLSFVDGEHTAGGKIGVLLGTAVSAIIGAVMLSLSAKKARREAEQLEPEQRDLVRITGEERRGLAWDPIILAGIDDDRLPDPDLDHMARLDGLDLKSVEDEFVDHIEEEREVDWGPHSEEGDDGDEDELRYL